MENRYYDDVSIASQAKREHFMKQAEEYRLHRHIAAMKNMKAEKVLVPEKRRKYELSPRPAHRPAPAQ